MEDRINLFNRFQMVIIIHSPQILLLCCQLWQGRSKRDTLDTFEDSKGDRDDRLSRAGEPTRGLVRPHSQTDSFCPRRLTPPSSWRRVVAGGIELNLEGVGPSRSDSTPISQMIVRTLAV